MATTTTTSINLRQLRDTRRLKAYLKAGKTVELRERDKLIARIVPANGKQPPVKIPDFAARAKAILGDRILPNAVLELRKKARY